MTYITIQSRRQALFECPCDSDTGNIDPSVRKRHATDFTDFTDLWSSAQAATLRGADRRPTLRPVGLRSPASSVKSVESVALLLRSCLVAVTPHVHCLNCSVVLNVLSNLAQSDPATPCRAPCISPIASPGTVITKSLSLSPQPFDNPDQGCGADSKHAEQSQCITRSAIQEIADREQ